jgi:hypothetical protein
VTHSISSGRVVPVLLDLTECEINYNYHYLHMVTAYSNRFLGDVYHLTKHALIFTQRTPGPLLQHTLISWPTYMSKVGIYQYWEKRCSVLMHDQKTTAEMILITALELLCIFHKVKTNALCDGHVF